mgnify:CR=1 FL=1
MKKNVLFVVLMFVLVLVGCAEHEHSWKVVSASEPTCSVEGEKVFKCEGCGATRTEKIEKLAHSFGEWNGETQERTCSGCGLVERPMDLTFLEKYEKDATTKPEGFSFTDSHSDVNNPELVEREVHISSKEALLYYAYRFDKNEAFNSCKNHGGSTGDAYCIWYQNTYVNSGHTFETTVYLDCDVDFENEILPSGMEIYGTTLKGQGHTIKNVRIYGSKAGNGNAGLFHLGAGGNSFYASIEDLNIENVHVETNTKNNENAHAGVVVSIGTTSISNVHVTNSSAVGGKYTGVIAGFIDGGSITDCSVENCMASGQYKIGGAVGQIGAGEGDVKNNSFKNVEIKVENLIEGKTSATVGKVVGDYNCDGECSGNSFEGVLPEGFSDWIGKIETGRNVSDNN